MNENKEHRQQRQMGRLQEQDSCNTGGGEVAVLSKLLLSRLDRLKSVKHFQTYHRGLPQLLLLPWDLDVVLQASEANTCYQPWHHLLPHFLFPATTHCLQSQLFTGQEALETEERFLWLGNKYTVYPIPAAIHLSTAVQQVLRHKISTN